MPARLYDSDFFAWTVATAAGVRERRFTDIDTEALAEEIEDLGRSTKRALESRLAVLLAHLLKWGAPAGTTQPELACSSSGTATAGPKAAGREPELADVD